MRSTRQNLAVLTITVIAVLAHASAPMDAHAFSLKNMASGIYAGGNACVRSCQWQRNKCVIKTRNLSKCSKQLNRCLEACIRQSKAGSKLDHASAAMPGKKKGGLRCKILGKC